MIKCRMATLKENLVFQQKYCKSAESREKLILHFMVTVEAYEELSPWYSTSNAADSNILLKNNIIVFRVIDLTNLIEYYPIFSAAEGLRLLQKWRMEVSPRLTAFTTYLLRREKRSAGNASLQSLKSYSSLEILEEGKKHTHMTPGFSNLYHQLCNHRVKSRLRRIYC